MKPRIMAIDDDERTLRLIEAMLSPNGYDVIQLKGGKGIVEAIHKHKPNLVLLDIMMPEADGYTTLTTIKNEKETRNIPVIMVTSVSQDMNKRLAYVSGADGYVTKPINMENLLKMIRRFIPQSQTPA